ncbi:hypothetical protein ACIGHN_27610 [Acidovorax sp. NPDC077693]|uniref:hypothetical protein n=1 Tax=unclassified Acidovorax TaxID=2684926 RepID=UPI0037CA47D7
MDLLTFISRVVDSLAWPVAAIVLGLIFRKKLLDLIPNLRKFKAGPLEAEFELAAKHAREGSADLHARDAVPDAPRVIVNPSEEREYAADPGEIDATSGASRSTNNPGIEDAAAKLLIARTEPTATIIEGWTTLDSELHKLGRQTGLVVDPLEGHAKVFQTITASDVLPAGTRQLIRELRHLRNQVAHAEVIPTPDSAQDYLVAIERVVQLVRNYRKNLPGYTADVR